MTQVTVDDAFREQLTHNGPDVQIRDRDGRVIGYFLSPEAYQKMVYDWARGDLPTDAIEQARAEYRRQGGLTTAQVLDRLNRLIDGPAAGA
jgi:hypothetical protein